MVRYLPVKEQVQGFSFHDLPIRFYQDLSKKKKKLQCISSSSNLSFGWERDFSLLPGKKFFL